MKRFCSTLCSVLLYSVVGCASYSERGYYHSGFGSGRSDGLYSFNAGYDRYAPSYGALTTLAGVAALAAIVASNGQFHYALGYGWPGLQFYYHR